MTQRIAKPVTVTLGGMAKSAQAHVASGRYASISEVVRAGLRALDREEEALHDLLRMRIAKLYEYPNETSSLDDAASKVRSRLETKWANDAV